MGKNKEDSKQGKNLIGCCCGINCSLRLYSSMNRAVSQRGEEKKKRYKGEKNVLPAPPAPTANTEQALVRLSSEFIEQKMSSTIARPQPLPKAPSLQMVTRLFSRQ